MRLLGCGIRLGMARPHRDVAEIQRLEHPPDAALIQKHEKPRQYSVPKIAQPPAHNAIFRDIRALPDPARDLRLLFV